MNELFEIKKLDYYISKNVYSMRQTPPRTVEHYEFELYTTSGNISIINDRKYNQNIGNILIAKPGDIRYTIDAFECYCVHFLCRDSEIQKSLNTLPNVFHSYGTERLTQIFKNMLNAQNLNNPAKKFILQGGVSEILGCFLDDASKEYTGEYEQYLTAVNAACSFIQNNLEQRITLSEISKKVCLSPRFFHGVFKSVKGITPSEYLLEQRIILAKKLLRLNNSSLSEIAMQCGFGSQGYFSYVFKNYTGITPKKYRDKKQIII